jgi:hypothetical protein
MPVKAIVLKRHHCSQQRFAPIDGHAKLTLQNLRYNGGSSRLFLFTLAEEYHHED